MSANIHEEVNKEMSSLPVLYSFRRCPYAIRARLALAMSAIQYEHKEVLLKNKPEAMLQASPKGTVPVLVLSNDDVIDESLDIMLWALNKHDPDNILPIDTSTEFKRAMDLIHCNDFEFKNWLDRYKYSDRYLEYSAQYYREQAELFISKLEILLSKTKYLNGDSLTFCDLAIAPFIRQFAHVDKTWFYQTKYHRVIRWLNNFLESEVFNSVMQKISVSL